MPAQSRRTTHSTLSLRAGWTIFKSLFPFHYVAWMTVSASISESVNQPTEDKMKERLIQWRKSMLTQLGNVEIISAIIAAVVVGAFTWKELDNIDIVPITKIKSTWYPSLILAVAAVGIGVQQSVFLMRLESIPRGHMILRDLLSFEVPNSKREPFKNQILLWQLAGTLLEFSIYFWLGGFLVFVWHDTKMGSKDQDVSGKVIAGICYSSFFVALIAFLFSMLGLWLKVWNHKHDLGYL